MSYPSNRSLLVLAAGFLPSLALANAFIPSMLSASILWVLVLPAVVLIEGLVLRRWGWANPFKVAWVANLLSIVAAFPVGIGLTNFGAKLCPMFGRGPLMELGIPDGAVFFTCQVLFYGQAPQPSFGFVSGSSSFAQAFGAAAVFMGLCWVLTVVVEGWYLGRTNRSVRGWVLTRKVLMMHLLSYFLLAISWLPAAYSGAQKRETMFKNLCARADSVASQYCPAIWEKYPQVLRQRLDRCANKGLSEAECLSREGT